jgi:hypothetical protein
VAHQGGRNGNWADLTQALNHDFRRGGGPHRGAAGRARCGRGHVFVRRSYRHVDNHSWRRGDAATITRSGSDIGVGVACTNGPATETAPMSSRWMGPPGPRPSPSTCRAGQFGPGQERGDRRGRRDARDRDQRGPRRRGRPGCGQGRRGSRHDHCRGRGHQPQQRRRRGRDLDEKRGTHPRGGAPATTPSRPTEGRAPARLLGPP